MAETMIPNVEAADNVESHEDERIAMGRGGIMDEKSKTPVGKEIERNITFAVDELKTTSERMGFIRHGLKDPDDIEGAMACLYLIETHLDELILDIKDIPAKVAELDALAAGEAPFIPQTRHEKDAIAALKRAQGGEFDLSLSRVMCRAVLQAEAAFMNRCKSILVEDADIAALVEGLNPEDNTAGEVTA